MDRFMDVQLLPDPELPAHVLLSALFGKLHRALTTQDGMVGRVAVSFPGYSDLAGARGLGDSLRLLGNQVALQALFSTDWVGSLRDHVSVGTTGSVPGNALHRTVRRVQAKSNPERLRRRLIKRHGIDTDEARERIPDSAAEVLRLPYLQLHSASTGGNFKLFLRLGPLQASGIAGEFNAYGLSTTATVPWF